MLFTIQTYVEEYLSKRNIIDSDGYAVRIANLYFYYRSKTEDARFLSRVGRLRTVLFLNNAIPDRKVFEQSLIRRLDKKFKKKLGSSNEHFPGGITSEKQRLQQLPKRTIGILLNEFTRATEARAIDMFWGSRKDGRLQHRPEKIAQGLFTLFTTGTLVDRGGLVLREFQSGVGFVDVGIVFSSVLHLVEIKVITGGFTGLAQLEQYMKAENRQEGALLIFDARMPNKKIEFPAQIATSAGIVRVYRVDINPIPPSKLN